MRPDLTLGLIRCRRWRLFRLRRGKWGVAQHFGNALVERGQEFFDAAAILTEVGPGVERRRAHGDRRAGGAARYADDDFVTPAQQRSGNRVDLAFGERRLRFTAGALLPAAVFDQR